MADNKILHLLQSHLLMWMVREERDGVMSSDGVFLGATKNV